MLSYILIVLDKINSRHFKTLFNRRISNDAVSIDVSWNVVAARTTYRSPIFFFLLTRWIQQFAWKALGVSTDM